MMKQMVRIIGGKYRGRKLHFPDIKGLRPTSDRIRETLFNWLMYDIQDASVLDAFAGSGALGFEAASRGARSVVMVEASKIATNGLRKQADLWGDVTTTILCQDVLDYLQHCKNAFDIIFLDPPFGTQLLNSAIDLILKRNLLAPQGIIYVETSITNSFDASVLTIIKEKKAGQVCYRLLKS